MTDRDTVIGSARLAWLLGAKVGPLLRVAYQVIPSSQWPSRTGTWVFTPDQAEAIRARLTPDMMHAPLTTRSDGEMKDLLRELSIYHRAEIEAYEDLAAIMRELIYDYNLPVTLQSRDYLGSTIELHTEEHPNV